MATQRKIEIFSAGCVVCVEAIEAIRQKAFSSCDVVVLDMNRIEIAQRAKSLGIRSVPAVVIEGMVSACCTGRGIDLEVLKAGLDRSA